MAFPYTLCGLLAREFVASPRPCESHVHIAWERMQPRLGVELRGEVAVYHTHDTRQRAGVAGLFLHLFGPLTRVCGDRTEHLRVETRVADPLHAGSPAGKQWVRVHRRRGHVCGHGRAAPRSPIACTTRRVWRRGLRRREGPHPQLSQHLHQTGGADTIARLERQRGLHPVPAERLLAPSTDNLERGTGHRHALALPGYMLYPIALSHSRAPSRMASRPGR